MTHVVIENCHDCRFTDCVASCPVSCFHVDALRAYIDPQTCIDCGACIPACPVHAIVEEFDLSDEQRHWLGVNAEAVRRYPAIRAKLPPLPTAALKRASLGY